VKIRSQLGQREQYPAIGIAGAGILWFLVVFADHTLVWTRALRSDDPEGYPLTFEHWRDATELEPA
jgi:hypothetical protein